MREIKFRAWHKEQKRMFPVYYLSWFSGILLIGDEQAAKSMRFGAGEVVLRQYTGLRDKNGCEIYEGDIVAAGIGAQYAASVVRIGSATTDGSDHCYAEEYYGVYLEPSYGLMDELLNKRLLVIGNIYEHPALIQ